MDANLSLSLEAIEGIGPQLAGMLAAGGMYVVADLLRVAPERVHESVSGSASIGQVRSWGRMCALLQVEGMTPQWAEALVRGGVASVETFAGRPPSELRALFAGALAVHRIPDEPDADRLSLMQVDAARLWMGLSLAGVVRTSGGAVVAGCLVRVGNLSAHTDERGAFRITRIPAWQVPEVTLDHPEHLLALVRLDRFLANSLLHTRLFELTRLASGSTRPSSKLSQFDGQSLPSLAGRRFRTQEVPREQLRRGDLFQLHSFYETAPDAKLVSKLLDLIDGEVRVHWVRVPRTELPADAAVGQAFLFGSGGFTRLKLDARKLAAYVKLQRAKRAIQLLPQPHNAAEFDALFPAIAGELVRAGVFQRIS